MRYACASPLSALIPAGWSVIVTEPKLNLIGFKPASDNAQHPLDAQIVDSITDIMSSTPEGRKADSGETVTNDSDDPDIEHPSTRPIPGRPILQILDGNLQQTSMADGFLAHVWEHLSRSEEAELNLSLRDDLRISKLCVLEVEAGNPDPWRTAFWNYLGLSPEKFQGILAEREAFGKTLGKTLAQELENPAFLKSLSAEARPFYAFPQMKLDFSVLPSPKKPSQSAPFPQKRNVA